MLLSVASLSDTNSEAEELQLELLRAAPPWRKLEMAFALNRTLQGLIAANVSGSPSEIQRALAERWLGAELAKRAYGDPPTA